MKFFYINLLQKAKGINSQWKHKDKELLATNAILFLKMWKISKFLSNCSQMAGTFTKGKDMGIIVKP